MKRLLGMILLSFGLLFSFYNENQLHVFMNSITYTIEQYWAFAFIVFGIYLVLTSKTKKKKRRNK